MHAYVHKRQRKADTWGRPEQVHPWTCSDVPCVCLAACDDFARLPQALRTRPGGTATGGATRRPVVSAGRKPTPIRGNRVLRGFHMSTPPVRERAPMSGDRAADA